MTLSALAENQAQPHVTLNTWRAALGGAEGAWSNLRLGVAEVTLSALSGASVTATGLLPDRAIILGVLSETVEAVTGAASYDVGISGDVSKFGGSLGVSAGASNSGVVGPFATYAAGSVIVTANGGAFTGGSIRLSVSYLLPGLQP